MTRSPQGRKCRCTQGDPYCPALALPHSRFCRFRRPDFPCTPPCHWSIRGAHPL